MVRNAIVLLLGFPGTAKLTIARASAPMSGAKIVDNHWINNPIFGRIDTDGATALPVAVWGRTEEVRQAVMETIATLADPVASFIFTYFGLEERRYDIRQYDLMCKTAEPQSCRSRRPRQISIQERAGHPPSTSIDVGCVRVDA